MPEKEQKKKNFFSKARGVANRNKALEWILQNGNENGVFYFADDDNTYDSELFTEVNIFFTVNYANVGRTPLQSLEHFQGKFCLLLSKQYEASSVSQCYSKYDNMLI